MNDWNVIPSQQSLRLPRGFLDVTDKPSGLFLLSGPTRHGKNTTLVSKESIANALTVMDFPEVKDIINIIRAKTQTL